MFNPFDLYKDNSLKIVLVLLCSIPVILLSLYFFAHDLFAEFIFRPVYVDAMDSGASKYNVYNILVYGYFVIVSLLTLYEMIDRLDIEIDDNFGMALIPWIIAGASARVLEDAGAFDPVSRFMYISPLIYVFFGVLAIFVMIIGALNRGDRSYIKLAGLMSPLLFVTLITGLPFVISIFIIVLGYIAFYTVLTVNIGFVIDEKVMILGYGIGLFFVYTSYLIYAFVLVGNVYTFIKYSFIISGCVSLSMYLSYRNEIIPNSWGVLNLDNKLSDMIIFSHLLDGMITYFAISTGFYVEKNVLSSWVIGLFPLYMLVVFKFIFAVIIVLVVDNTQRQSNLDAWHFDVLRIFFLILGLAPALRNVFRVILGI